MNDSNEDIYAEGLAVKGDRTEKEAPQQPDEAPLQLDNVTALHSKAATRPPLKADRPQIEAFIDAVFRHVDPESFVSLRAFHQNDRKKKALFIHGIRLGDPALLDVTCQQIAYTANQAEPYVFSPPVGTFKTAFPATEKNLADGPALSIECDKYPAMAKKTLCDLLGQPTAIVMSGGMWQNPQNTPSEPKIHLHWRLKTPARTPEEHKKLKELRYLATHLVGADTSAVTIVHPLRWPGSWHRKNSPPVLATITELNPDVEIELDDALKTLQAVSTPAVKASAAASRKGVSDGDHRAPIFQIRAAMRVVPNEDLDWSEWVTVGMAIWRASGGDDEGGLEVFDEWSQKSCKYDPSYTVEQWEHFSISPPDRIGAGSIIHWADAAYPCWREGIEYDDTEIPFKAVEAPPTQPDDAHTGEPPVTSLEEVHRVFRKWFGPDYDLDAINAVAAGAASERLKGDPLWLLVISGPGATKTEASCFGWRQGCW